MSATKTQNIVGNHTGIANSGHITETQQITPNATSMNEAPNCISMDKVLKFIIAIINNLNTQNGANVVSTDIVRSAVGVLGLDADAKEKLIKGLEA
jgi:hypothetical protein